MSNRHLSYSDKLTRAIENRVGIATFCSFLCAGLNVYGASQLNPHWIQTTALLGMQLIFAFMAIKLAIRSFRL